MSTKKKQENSTAGERGALIRITASGISLTVIEKEGEKVSERLSVFFQSFPYGETLIEEGVVHQFHHIIPLFRTALEELLVFLAKEKISLDGIHFVIEESYAYTRMYELDIEGKRVLEEGEILHSIDTDDLELIYGEEVEFFSLHRQGVFLNGHPVSTPSHLQEVKDGELKVRVLASFSEKNFLTSLREEVQGHFPLIEVSFSSRSELFALFVPFLATKEEDHFHLIDIHSLSTNVITRSPSGYLTFSSFSDGSLHIIKRVAEELSSPFHKVKHLFLKHGHEHFHESSQRRFQNALLKSLREWESILYTHFSSVLDETELSPKLFTYADILLVEEELKSIFEEPLFIDAFFPKREGFFAQEILSSLLPGKKGMQLRKSISHQHLPAFLAFHQDYITKRYGEQKEKNK